MSISCHHLTSHLMQNFNYALIVCRLKVSGYEAGYPGGRAQGLVDGFSTGFTQGIQLADEVTIMSKIAKYAQFVNYITVGETLKYFQLMFMPAAVPLITIVITTLYRLVTTLVLLSTCWTMCVLQILHLIHMQELEGIGQG